MKPSAMQAGFLPVPACAKSADAYHTFVPSHCLALALFPMQNTNACS